MISNPVNTVHQQPASFSPAQPHLHAKPAIESVPHNAPEPSSVPSTRSGPRWWRSTGLENGPANSQAQPAVRSASASGSQTVTLNTFESLGNIHNAQALATALDEVRTVLAQDPDVDVASLLETKRFSVHSRSTFGLDNQLKPGEQLSVAWYLRESLHYVPQNLEQLSNLIEVSKSQLNEQHVQGGFRRGLASLSSEQRIQLHGLVSAEVTASFSGSGLFKFFKEKHGASIQGKSAAEVLETMVNSLLN